MRKCVLVILCLVVFSFSTLSQNTMPHFNKKAGQFLYSLSKAFPEDTISRGKNDTIYRFEYVTDTSASQEEHADFYFAGWQQGTCKRSVAYFIKRTYTIKAVIVPETKKAIVVQEPSKVPFLTIHGNVRYILNYRSFIDTPFSANDVYQHTIQSYLDVTLKDRYPMRVYLTTNFSNTPMLKNFTNVNFGFNSNDYVNKIRQQVAAWSAAELQNRLSELSNLKDALADQREHLQRVQQWLTSPANYQKLIEEREKEYVRKTRPDLVNEDNDFGENKINVHVPPFIVRKNASTDELIMQLEKLLISKSGKTLTVLKEEIESIDSSKTKKKITEEYADKQKEYDSLAKTVAKMESEYEQQNASLNHKRDSMMTLIQKAKDVQSLKQQLNTLNLPDSILNKSDRRLLALRSFNIGTVPMNYSELTIRNINITGVQAEYNPSYYFAIAAGTISYQFRNFFLNQSDQPHQYVSALRFGKGQVDGNHIIGTWYSGKRYVYSMSQSMQTISPTTYLTGFSIEARYQLNRNNFVVGEYAKSSLPYYSSSPDKSNALKSTFHFSDRTNEAYSLKLQSYIPETQTKLIANYRRLGNNFQSFSLFTNSATQDSWYIKFQQALFKRKLTIDAGLRQNDFSNPYVVQQYNSKIVFKSVQATLRIKRIPVVSVGYFPSSQILKINDAVFSEQMFYTLVGTATHSYHASDAMLNSALVYTQFYNDAADSGFVYFNTRNVQLNQTISLPKYSLQGNISAASNNYYNLYAIGGSMDYHVSKWLSIGGGMKYNKQTAFDNNLLGYLFKTRLRLPKLGSIDIFYEKGFMPGMHHDLVDNSTGWLTYTKVF